MLRPPCPSLLTPSRDQVDLICRLVAYLKGHDLSPMLSIRLLFSALALPLVCGFTASTTKLASATKPAAHVIMADSADSNLVPRPSELYPSFFDALPSQAGKAFAITGCSRGLGFATAMTLAKKGRARLYLLNRNSGVVAGRDLLQFLIKFVCAAASWYCDPARFRQSVWPCAACELTYSGMRAYFAHGRPGGDRFAQPEGPVLSFGPMPKAVSALFKLAALTTLVSSPCWYVFPKLVAKFGMPQQARLKGVGVALCTLGLALQFLSHLYLGTNWSTKVETQASQKLCVRGVYSQVRNPMYTAFLAFAVGILFLTANWLVGLSYITSVAVVVFSRLTPEEDMMAARFGQEYDTYRARTGALVPPQAGARVATTVLCCAAAWYVLGG